MKLFKSPSYIIKTFISLFIFIIFGLIINELGICQIDKLSNVSDQQNKSELKEGNSVNVVPYTKGASGSLSSASITKGTKLEQTVKGLKDAGYPLDEITVILKNDKNDASTVSIACLKQGFSGQHIYKALMKSGYSKNSADLAVPLSVRKEIEVLDVSTNYNEAINEGLAKNNSIAAASEVLEVPVSVGITFNGLGNWGYFQDNRYKSEK